MADGGSLGPRRPESERRSGAEPCDALLEHARQAGGFDPSGYCPAVLRSRIQTRISATGAGTPDEYLRRLREDPAELGALAEALTVKVSSFFRDPLAFELLAANVLPELLARKAAAGDASVRVWSAGCATGEEPYSIAILLAELLGREPGERVATVVATDLDERALERARAARYPEAALANVRHGLLGSAFVPEGALFRVAPQIAASVTFAAHDLLDPRSGVPAESIFGSFDLVLCRNVLLYFEPDWQESVCEKLYRSLAPGGHLLLGRTEVLPGAWAGRFERSPALRYLFQKPFRRAAGLP
jgi:chemotaxis methyl-accepting protein methylase